MSEAKIELESGTTESDVVDQLEELGMLDIGTDEAQAKEPAKNDEAEAKEEVETSDADDEQETEEVENKDDEAAEEAKEDEQVIEYQNEAGETVELSLSDALESHGKVEKLTERNTELETQAQLMPEQIKTIAMSMETTLGQYQQELETAISFFGEGDIKVSEPDRSLLDPNSAKYDPEKYQDELISRDKQVSQQTELRQEHTRISGEKNKYTQQLQENYRQEQINKTNVFWPEVVSNKDTYDGVKSFLGEYDFTPEEAASVIDSRQLKMVKELMELKADKKKAKGDVKKAMKIVVNNPKLTKRSAKAPHTTKDQNAMNRLNKSGSDKDGVAAILALDI